MIGRQARTTIRSLAVGVAACALPLSALSAAHADTLPSAPVMTLVSSENPAPSDATPTFMAALNPAPTCGTVTWTIDGAPPAATVATSGSGGSYQLGPVAGLTVGDHTVAAAYSGCDTALATSGSLTETILTQTSVPPTISAAVSSAEPKHHGWYSQPVRVDFSCRAGSAPFNQDDCPGPVLLTKSQAGQSVTATITDSAGRTGSVKVSGIDIDRVSPTLRVTGALDGATYRHNRHLTCHARDDLSGVAKCSISKASRVRRGVKTVHWSAYAKDDAGNVRVLSGKYRVLVG